MHFLSKALRLYLLRDHCKSYSEQLNLFKMGSFFKPHHGAPFAHLKRNFQLAGCKYLHLIKHGSSDGISGQGGISCVFATFHTFPERGCRALRRDRRRSLDEVFDVGCHPADVAVQDDVRLIAPRRRVEILVGDGAGQVVDAVMDKWMN